VWRLVRIPVVRVVRVTRVMRLLSYPYRNTVTKYQPASCTGLGGFLLTPPTWLLKLRKSTAVHVVRHVMAHVVCAAYVAHV